MSTSITSLYGFLPHLPAHFHIFAGSVAVFFATQLLAGPVLKVVSPKTWNGFRAKNKQEWGTRVASTLHCLLIIPLALSVYDSPSLRHDPVLGYDARVGNVLAVAAGFLWDTIDSILHSSPGFMLHGVACLAVFGFSFRPFCAYFGPSFLLWELSTPFLNARWFFDKLGLASRFPTLSLINDACFALAFFLARICLGALDSMRFFRAIVRHRQDAPVGLLLVYAAGNLALNGLNWFWFSKIFQKLVRTIGGSGAEKNNGRAPKASPGVKRR